MVWCGVHELRLTWTCKVAWPRSAKLNSITEPRLISSAIPQHTCVLV